MITKGFIQQLPSSGENKFIVRIPLFESPGIGHTKDRLNTSDFEATLCYQPGNFQGYNVGDCVWITFESDNIEHPVIVGKLYTGDEETSSTYMCPDNLNVSGIATLPKSTSVEDINIYESLKMMKKMIEKLETRVNSSNS